MEAAGEDGVGGEGGFVGAVEGRLKVDAEGPARLPPLVCSGAVPFSILHGVTPLVVLAGLVVFAAISFFFALAETALFSLSKWQLRQLAERRPESGLVLQKLLSEPDDLLATIVLGNTLANAALVAASLWLALGEGWNMFASAGVTFLITLLGCEIAPKTLAVRAPERFASALAGSLLLVQQLSRPVRRVMQRLNEILLGLLAKTSIKPLPGMTDDEYEELVELAFQQGTLAAGEREIILQIVGLDRRTAKDVMQPRSRMATVSDEASIEEMAVQARKLRRRYLPIYDRANDNVVGILNARLLLLDPNTDMIDLIEIPASVPETMNLLQLLQALQRQRRGVALVLDEYGGTAGIVSMEDILAEVVGRFRAEQTVQGFVMERIGPGRWRVNGAMRIDDFHREHPDIGEVEHVDTMGGLLMRQIEAVPKAGESAVFRGLKLTATSVDERRVRELLVEQAGKG